MPALRLPRKRTVLIAGAVVVALLLAWLLAAYQLFYNVHTPAPKQADAVVMLGGASKERLLDAMMLRNELNAPYLVISHTDTPGNASADDYCNTHSNKAIYPDVVCFTPATMDTRGEASALGKLAAEHQWKNMAVVTSKYHIQRAGLLMHQCVNADVRMFSTTPQFSTWQWLRRFVIETGGLLDVHLRPQCESLVGK
ncbi:YdcF family protein [Arthrobacter wenxiniae]|uniref:YdcF family protein n=1 Tax=Arthrobacter wenxiniae TaxID=2713570 RepID=A0A7Y7IH72_9MICC|nr:YdcF family protein [Arthrobacter wenxiniae]NVM94846.1 YdcF family protein [Arthrobacter wenxiniae]